MSLGGPWVSGPLPLKDQQERRREGLKFLPLSVWGSSPVWWEQTQVSEAEPMSLHLPGRKGVALRVEQALQGDGY